MRKFGVLFFLTSILFGAPFAYAEKQDLNFAVIQPGQPGTAAEAQPVMEALSKYLQEKLGPDCVFKGRYFNELKPALSYLETQAPKWGIVQLGVFVQYGKHFQMTPVAATRPGGFEQDVWRIVTTLDGDSNWESLRGEVLGNMLFEPAAASCLLLERPSKDLPFQLKGTFQPLRTLRSVARGKTSGAVLDRVQYETVKTISLGKRIKVIHTSAHLPTSPVVWFGSENSAAGTLARLLQDMKKDPAAADLLKLLQTDGFGPPDETLLPLRQKGEERGCFAP